MTIQQKLEAYVQTKAFQKKINANTKALNLKSKTEILKGYIQEEIDNYYNSYSPKSQNYQRTFEFQKSLILTEDNGKYIITFDKSKAYHDSILGGEQGYVPTLINDGFSWQNQPRIPIERFTYYDGFHFIEKAIKRFKKENKGVKVMVFWSNLDMWVEE